MPTSACTKTARIGSDTIERMTMAWVTAYSPLIDLMMASWVENTKMPSASVSMPAMFLCCGRGDMARLYAQGFA